MESILCCWEYNRASDLLLDSMFFRCQFFFLIAFRKHRDTSQQSQVFLFARVLSLS